MQSAEVSLTGRTVANAPLRNIALRHDADSRWKDESRIVRSGVNGSLEHARVGAGIRTTRGQRHEPGGRRCSRCRGERKHQYGDGEQQTLTTVSSNHKKPP